MPQPFYLNLDFYGDVLTSDQNPDDPDSYDTTGAGSVVFPASIRECDIPEIGWWNGDSSVRPH